MKTKIIIIYFLLFFINSFANTIDNSLKKDVHLSKEEEKFLKEHDKITLGSDDQWAPYIIKEQNQNISGFDKDILDLVNKYTGANFQLRTGKWKNILEKAKNKEIDGLSTSAVHEERKNYFNFSDPYISVERLLVTSIDNSKKINSINDLDNKKLAYLKYNLFEKKLASQFKNTSLVPLPTLKDIINKLIKGEVDAAIGSHTLLSLADKRSLPYLKIVDFIPNSTLDLVFSIRKEYPEALSILNKGLKNISELERINLRKKWFFKENTTYEPKNEKYHLNLTKEEKNYLREKGSLSVQNLNTFPPFNYNENGIPKGYAIDYMKLVSKYLDIKINFISGKPWH